jgi:hypothetical protein
MTKRVIVNPYKDSQAVPAGLNLIVNQGDTVKTDQALNRIQMRVVLVKKNLKSYYKTLYESLVILLSVSLLLTQISLVLKKNNLKKFKLQS